MTSLETICALIVTLIAIIHFVYICRIACGD